MILVLEFVKLLQSHSSFIQNVLHNLGILLTFNSGLVVNLSHGKIIEKEANMRKRRLDKILEMPEEVYSNTPKLTIIGFNEIVLENYKGILEYEEYFASISTHIGIVNINGYNINLEKMTNDDIKITGKIESVELERTHD